MRIPLPAWTSSLGLLALAGASGCAPHVSVEVLQPALVTMPADVHTLAVIDRSAPKNVGQNVLGALEGAVTGEAIGADREGAARAVETTVATLSGSPRYTTVVPITNKDQVESDIFDKEMSWEAAKKICKKTGADAIVALEAFDSDSALTLSTEVEDTTDANGKPMKQTVHVAQRESTVLTAWRVYYPKDKLILDDLRDHRYGNTWEERAATEDAAISALPSQYDTIMTLGTTAGEDYARRIAPTYVNVSRDYYGKGSDTLKQAKYHAKAQDWDGACDLWKAMLDDGDPKLRGRAEYDMALYWETQGELEKALASAKKAAVDLHNGRSRNYVSILQIRLVDQQKLEEQMREEPKDEPKTGGDRPAGDDRPAAIPAGGDRPTSSGGKRDASPK